MDMLSRFTKHKNNLCIFCGNHPETMQHLIVECMMTKRIWQVVSPTSPVLNSAFNFHNWLLGFFSTSNNIHDCSLLENISFVQWHIWKSRCKNVFENLQVMRMEWLDIFLSMSMIGTTYSKQPLLIVV